MSAEQIIQTIDDCMRKLNESIEEIKKSEDIRYILDLTYEWILNYYSKTIDLIESYEFSSQEEFNEIELNRRKQMLNGLTKISQVSSLRVQVLSGETSPVKAAEAYRRIGVADDKTER